MTKDLKEEYLTQHDLKKLPKALPPSNDDHAVYSPSAAKRWMNCPGSINACKDLPRQKPNFYSVEGTLAHEIAAHFINKAIDIFYISIIPLESKTDSIHWNPVVKEQTYGIGQYTRKGIPIKTTEEMFDAIKTYVDFVVGLGKKYGEKPEIERRVKITEDCFGTADSCIYVPYTILITNDYKHGAGIVVDVEDNEQTMIYTLGRLLELPKDELAELPWVEMNIVQPRAHGDDIKTYKMRTKDLLTWHQEELLPAIARTKMPNAPLNAGPWCKYCPAALTCPALKKENLAVAKMAFQDPVQWIDVMTPKQIAELLDKETMVMSFYKRLNEHAAELASKNTKIPGYIYQKKYGNRKWKDEQAVFDFAERNMIDLDEITTAKLKTPKQCEKAIPKKHLAKLVEVPFTGWGLKKANGKEITIKEVFSDVDVID